MADNQQLEQKEQTTPEKKEEKKGEKKIGTLESVVSESWNAVKSSVKLAGAVLMPYAITKAVPAATLDTITLTGGNIAADATTNYRKGKKISMWEIFKSSAVGSAISLPTHYAYKALNKIALDNILGYVKKGAAMGGIVYPAFIGAYQSVDYLVRNLTFRGLGKYLKDNYLPTLKKAWKYLLPISLLNIFFVPSYFQVAVGSALSYVFSLFGAPKKEELKEHEKRQKGSYIAAGAKALGRLGYNLFYAPLKAVEYIGSSIKNWYQSAPKQASPAPSPAPAK